MAASARKICSHPGCPNLQPCLQHARPPWHGSTRRRRLPPGWSHRIVPRILARDPVCKICGERPSTEVDHIHPGDDHRDANLQGVCAACHRAKTLREAAAARRARGNAADDLHDQASMFVIVETPEHSRTVQPGTPPTTLAAYRLAVEEGQTADEAVEAFAVGLPVGTVLHRVTLDRTFTVRATLEAETQAGDSGSFRPRQLLQVQARRAERPPRQAARRPGPPTKRPFESANIRLGGG